MSRITSTGSGPLEGVARIPGDKSISHRAVIFGAIATGETQITNLLDGEDVLCTIGCFREMGLEITGPDEGRLQICGVGLKGLTAPKRTLRTGNSGTTMRLLTGLLVGQQFGCTLAGDQSLQRRPMTRVIDPLVQMGAHVDGTEGRPPLTIQPVKALHTICYEMPVVSAQVKSAILLAGLYASGVTQVVESMPTRDHSERMLCAFAGKEWRPGGIIQVEGGACLRGQQVNVPGDISSAAFFLVGASICPGSDLLLTGVGVNPTRVAVLEILKMMGANIELSNSRVKSGEPVCDIRVRTASLRAIDVPIAYVASAIDEFPVLAIAAAAAQGTTRIRGAQELRIKESDRIRAVVNGLQALGVIAVEYPDGMDITGGPFQSGIVDSLGDHRIAMAFAIAGARAEGPVVIDDCDNIGTSFPGFLRLANTLGLSLSEHP